MINYENLLYSKYFGPIVVGGGFFGLGGGVSSTNPELILGSLGLVGLGYLLNKAYKARGKRGKTLEKTRVHPDGTLEEFLSDGKDWIKFT